MVLSSVRVCATAADMGKRHFRGVAPRSAKDSYPEEGKLRSLLTLESQQCQKTAVENIDISATCNSFIDNGEQGKSCLGNKYSVVNG